MWYEQNPGKRCARKRMSSCSCQKQRRPRGWRSVSGPWSPLTATITGQSIIQTRRQRSSRCATPLAQTHQCNVRVCETISCDHSEIVRMLDLTPSLQYNVIAALSPRTSAACAPSNRDESRWVKRYIMCPWPLAHGAHACAGLPMQIPPGQTQQSSAPILTPWESHLRSRADKDGK